MITAYISCREKVVPRTGFTDSICPSRARNECSGVMVLWQVLAPWLCDRSSSVRSSAATTRVPAGARRGWATVSWPCIIIKDPATRRRIAAPTGRSSTVAVPNNEPPGSCSVNPMTL